MPLRFQNVCRHRQTNNTGRLPPILTPHALFSHFPAPLLSSLPAFPENLLPAVSRRPAPHALFPHLSCHASFKLSRLSRKSPAGRLSPPLAPHTLFPHLSCRASFKLSRLSRKSPASRLPPILTPHALFPHLSGRASLKFAYLSRKSPAGRFMPPRTARVVSLLSGLVHRSPA